MALLIFHLVLSSFTFEGVDIRMAQKILDYHIQRYPNGTCESSRYLCTNTFLPSAPQCFGCAPWMRDHLRTVPAANRHLFSTLPL